MTDPLGSGDGATTAGPTESIGVAMLGVAHTPHAMSYARAVRDADGAHLVGVYDGDAELGTALADRFDTGFHDDVDTLLDAGAVHAVIVCSETDRHRELVETAARRGLAVLCEKPIATTLEDAGAMIRVCDEHSVQLHVAFVTRFYPVVQQVRAAIAAGSIGDVVAMVGGNRGRPPLAPNYPSWITDPVRSGGGALIDHSVHVTDVMRHLTGGEVVRVSAEVDDRFWTSGVDDMAALSVEFDSGAIAAIDPSWSVPAGNPWGYDFFLRVLGSNGAISIDDTAESLRFAGEDRMRLVPFGVDIDAAMVDAFLESIRAGELLDPCADGEDGYRALEIALAGYEAARTHDTVRLFPERRAMNRVAVRAARLVGVEMPSGPATIVADDGVITEIRPGHPSVDCAVVGDGSDVVAPGLIDVHTHGAVGVQAIDGDVEGLRRLGAFYASHGVTSYLATIGGSDTSIVSGLDGVRTLMDDAGTPPGARCLGVHLEGPFISSCCPGAFDPASIVVPDVATFERYVARSGGTLRHVTLAPEVDGQREVIAAARRLGVSCSAGHSAATDTEFVEAIELGVGAVTHMFNALPPMHHRQPGIVGVALSDERVIAELIADGVHVHPRVVAVLAGAKSTHTIALITDSIAATGLPDGDYHFEEQDIEVRGGEARLGDGTLAGSTLTLDRAVANFAEFVGIGWDEAVVSATLTPARLLGLHDRTGTIAVGNDADLAGFTPDGEVRWTLVGGRLVFDADEA